MDKQTVLSDIKTSLLPVLPPGAPHLLQNLADDSIGFHQLAAVIEQFPSIAARLIALANSSWSSPVAVVSSLEVACVRLGFSVVRSTSIALAIASPFNSVRCRNFSAERFWCRSLLVADTASWLSDITNQQSVEQMDTGTARAAGLLHNLGFLLLADQLPDETNEILLQHQQSESKLTILLQQQLGFDYCDAGKQLAEEWELPEVLLTAMAYHKKPEAAPQYQHHAKIIGCAISMVEAAEQSLAWQATEKCWLSEIDADAIFTRVTGQLEKTRQLAQTLFDA